MVIIGGGFGGLNAALQLAHLPVEITLVDRKNHHTFQPLLYQVAMAALSPAEIAWPIRNVLKGRENVEVLLGEVSDFNLKDRKVHLKDTVYDLPYDYLILATGATHAYFGHDEWAQDAPGLKTLEDALEIRRRVLLAFEKAELMAVSQGKYDPLNFVIVGAGATGVELAGAIAEIATKVMVEEFKRIDPKQARVILLEGGPRVLPAFPPDLSASAEKQLRDLGVEVRTNTMVTSIGHGKVCAGDETIDAAVTLWAAGVAASSLGKKLVERTGGDAKLDRAGRVRVGHDLSLPGNRNIFVIGDLAAYADEHGEQLPGVAQVAIQGGRFVGKAIEADLHANTRGTFHYFDKGSLATIGRTKAIGLIQGIHLTGFLAWIVWAGIHVAFLIEFRTRVMVMLEWAWAYLVFTRSARLITGRQ